MSFTTMLGQEVALHRTTSVGRDAIGGASISVETSVAVYGYLEPRSGSEDLANRNTDVGDWMLVLPADAVVTGWDRVTTSDRAFEIVAPPRPFYNPRTRSVHHWELDLTEVVGTAAAPAPVVNTSAFDSSFDSGAFH